MTTKEIVDAALKLERKERAHLASQLIDSRDAEEENLSPEEWERLWTEEIHRRMEELRQSKVKAIPGEESSRVPARTSLPRFEFHPAAEEEFFAALRFYREAVSGRVASDFDAELRRCIELVLHDPGIAPHFGGRGARGKLLRRFPYTLVYAPCSRTESTSWPSHIRADARGTGPAASQAKRTACLAVGLFS